MATRPTFTRWHAALIAGSVGIPAVSLVLAAGTPFYGYVAPIVMGAVAFLIVSDWRAKGHRWLPTLAWALPLTASWVVVNWLIGRDGNTIFLLGAVSFFVMSSTRAAEWWYEVVLRRPFKS